MPLPVVFVYPYAKPAIAELCESLVTIPEPPTMNTRADLGEIIIRAREVCSEAVSLKEPRRPISHNADPWRRRGKRKGQRAR
jgi:hypothetical protein